MSNHFAKPQNSRRTLQQRNFTQSELFLSLRFGRQDAAPLGFGHFQRQRRSNSLAQPIGLGLGFGHFQRQRRSNSPAQPIGLGLPC